MLSPLKYEDLNTNLGFLFNLIPSSSFSSLTIVFSGFSLFSTAPPKKFQQFGNLIDFYYPLIALRNIHQKKK